MNELDALIESYRDLEAQAIVPPAPSPELKGPDPADPVWLQARLAALRSIAHAAEDLDCAALEDEVDRTMLIDTIRYEMHQIRSVITPTTPDAMMEGRLAALTAEPTGIRGTLRLLELRRAGVERALHAAALTLGMDDPLATVRAIQQESLEVGPSVTDGWAEEWRRSATILSALDLPVVAGEPPPLLDEETDEWSFAALAVRGHAVAMLEAARAAQPRLARRVLVAPGLRAGWGRTVCALLKDTALFDLPERQLMVAWRALLDALAAEADLRLHAGIATAEETTAWVAERLGDEGEATSRLVQGIGRAPGAALAAALAHEGWQAWYAEDGHTAAEGALFLRRALAGGGLPVRLARWALGAPADGQT